MKNELMKKILLLLFIAQITFAQKEGYWDKERATTKEVVLTAGKRILIKTEEFGDSLVLVGTNDKDFNDAENIDGKPLYRWQELPSGTYPLNLQGWFSEADSIAWQAGIYVNKTAFVGHDKELEAFISASAKAKPAIKRAYGELE